MICLYPNKELARVMRMAVIDDKSPNPPGTVIEYWRGLTDWEPTFSRKDAFMMARALRRAGLVYLVQKRLNKTLGKETYSYRMVVK